LETELESWERLSAAVALVLGGARRQRMMKQWWDPIALSGAAPAHAEVDEELRFHLEQSIATKIAAGMTAQEARRQALIEFGGVERAREQCHEQRPGWWLARWRRMCAMRCAASGAIPFHLTVIATLALGIGANHAVFSVVDRILFRSLLCARRPYRFAGAGAIVGEAGVHAGRLLLRVADNQRPFEAMASQGTMLHGCDLIEANPAQLNCIHAQAGFLPLLGISPVLGRNFLPERTSPTGRAWL